MLWLKLLLGYCLLLGIGMWFGYRSRKSWPPLDDEMSALEVTGPEGPVEPRAGSATGLR